ncbi:ParB N-terminal domain-containing protein, partial [Oscillibacter sp. MSJ-31]|uniref:ParB/RepB/Spo0J family partition protein n=1 Tax=Oscillibacter sp. MSJ-31 TaxID=2841526 RepID=UPI001C121EA5
PAAMDKGKEAEKSAPAASTKAAPAKPAAMPAGPAAVGPTGTAITQVFDARLNPPDEKALKGLPIPKEGESYFITLHPAYLERSKYNNFSVDKDSDNFKELYKAVELTGIKDPVLARPKEGGGLEILSGQRRHLIGTELNYPIPTIIQRIDDADAKILVADSNLHRDKISTYDLSRALKMKMEGMKQKAGRKKKGELGEKLNTDEAIAKEMGITVSKFNRMLRMSEATKDVCSKVDDGTLALSIASALSFLKPKNQDMAVRLSDLGYRLSTERVEYLKRVEKAGRLTEDAMRKVLEGENILDPPKVVPLPVKQEKNSPAAVHPAPQVAATELSPSSVIPSSPDVAVPPAHVVPTTAVPVSVVNRDAPSGTVPEQEDDPFKGKQERAENTKVILSGDRLRKYYPDVSMTPREIEEDIYGKLERCRQMDEKQKAKDSIFKKGSTQQR